MNDLRIGCCEFGGEEQRYVGVFPLAFRFRCQIRLWVRLSKLFDSEFCCPRRSAPTRGFADLMGASLENGHAAEFAEKVLEEAERLKVEANQAFKGAQSPHGKR